MKTFLKMLGTILAGAVITFFSIALGYNLYNHTSSELPQVYANEGIYKGSNTAVVCENTVVRYIYHYSEDNQELIYEEKAPSYLQGLDTEGVKEALEGYEVCELTSDNLVLRKIIQGRSNTHYSIGEKDGYVAVFFENGILKEKTATPIEGLDPQIKAQIIKGIKINGSEELIRCLEDIES